MKTRWICAWFQEKLLNEIWCIAIIRGVKLKYDEITQNETVHILRILGMKLCVYSWNTEFFQHFYIFIIPFSEYEEWNCPCMKIHGMHFLFAENMRSETVRSWEYTECTKIWISWCIRSQDCKYFQRFD